MYERHPLNIGSLDLPGVLFLAPKSAFSPMYDEGTVHSNGPPSDSVPMTGLQIALSREIKGWPLYTIIIALGQASFSSFQMS